MSLLQFNMLYMLEFRSPLKTLIPYTNADDTNVFEVDPLIAIIVTAVPNQGSSNRSRSLGCGSRAVSFQRSQC
jgi:hypothetical protein